MFFLIKYTELNIFFLFYVTEKVYKLWYMKNEISERNLRHPDLFRVSNLVEFNYVFFLWFSPYYYMVRQGRINNFDSDYLCLTHVMTWKRIIKTWSLPYEVWYTKKVKIWYTKKAGIWYTKKIILRFLFENTDRLQRILG